MTEEDLQRVVAMSYQINLVALDKSLAAIRRASASWAAGAVRCGAIADRMVNEIAITKRKADEANAQPVCEGGDTPAPEDRQTQEGARR